MLTSQLNMGISNETKLTIHLLLLLLVPLLSSVSFQLQMNGEDQRWLGTVSPLAAEEDKGEGRVESSVNAVWFGLVATSVLIFIFLILAIFERFMFIRTTTSSALDRNVPPLASPKMGVSDREISVLMPGEEVPTFIAQPCPPPSSSSTSF